MAPQPNAQNGGQQGGYPWKSLNPQATQTNTQNADAISTATNPPSTTTQPPQSSSPSSNNPGAYPSSGGNNNPYASGDHLDNNLSGLPPWVMAVAVIVPILIVVISAVFIFLTIRSHRRQRRAAAAMPEMKDLTPARPRDERAYIRPPSSEPPPSIVVASSTPTESWSPTAAAPPTQRQSQPVILSTAMDQAYYTGIDTADHISLDSRSQASAELDDGDEPPPPYRPRSVPPISRDASVRTSRTARTSSIARRNRNNDQSASHLMAGMRPSQDLRSPFEDPEDEDDAASAISEVTIRPQRHAPQQDRLSIVSDLSYQDEPVQGRSSL